MNLNKKILLGSLLLACTGSALATGTLNISANVQASQDKSGTACTIVQRAFNTPVTLAIFAEAVDSNEDVSMVVKHPSQSDKDGLFCDDWKKCTSKIDEASFVRLLGRVPNKKTDPGMIVQVLPGLGHFSICVYAKTKANPSTVQIGINDLGQIAGTYSSTPADQEGQVLSGEDINETLRPLSNP